MLTMAAGQHYCAQGKAYRHFPGLHARVDPLQPFTDDGHVLPVWWCRPSRPNWQWYRAGLFFGYSADYLLAHGTLVCLAHHLRYRKFQLSPLCKEQAD